MTLYHGLQLVLSKTLRIGDTKCHIWCSAYQESASSNCEQQEVKKTFLALSTITPTATARYWSSVVVNKHLKLMSGAKSSFVQLDQKLIASVFIKAFTEERVKAFLKVSPLSSSNPLTCPKHLM